MVVITLPARKGRHADVGLRVGGAQLAAKIEFWADELASVEAIGR